MKNEVISKINTIGKAGNIISKIAKVIMIIGLVGCIVGTVLLSFIPKDFVTFNMSGDAVITVNTDNMPLFEIINFGDEVHIDKNEDDLSVKWDINDVAYIVSELEQNGNVINMYAEAESYKIDISSFKWFLIPVIVFMISALVVIHFIGILCKKFQYCSTPFTEDIVKAIKNLAISIIPMALLQSVTESITNSMMAGDIDIVVGIDLMTVILVILIFLLAAIFNYGTMLQKESDETL